MATRAMIVVAGGSAARFGGDKLLTPVAGKPLLAHTVSAVAPHADICVLVCRLDQIELLRDMDLGVILVPGGPTRTSSEMAGLSALGGASDLIAVHDGARPLVRPELIETVYQAAAAVGGAVPVIPPARPLLRRSDLALVRGAMAAQTPQAFSGPELLAAFLKAARIEYEAYDTAEIVTKFADLTVAAVPGDPENLKVTYPEDIALVEAVLRSRS